MEFLALLGSGTLFLATLGAMYAALAALLVRRFARPAAASPANRPSVTLLKPLYGAEPRLVENLLSFCRQSYGGKVQVICGVQDPADGAIDAVRTVQAAAPPHPPELVVDPTRHGSNLKVGNLINMAARARHEVIVLADSDMSVPADYLDRVVATLERPGVGAVTCLYHGVSTANLWSRLAALHIDLHFLPSALVGIASGLARPCFGSTIAMRAETLRRIGGFESVADILADDYALGDAVRRLGLTVELAPLVAGHACPEESLADLLAHELRWQRTIRTVDPAGFAGSVITHAMPLALLGTLLTGLRPLAFLVMAGVLISRLALLQSVDHLLSRKDRSWALVGPRDLLSFAVFVASFFVGAVSWRGARFQVRADGTMAKQRAADGPAPQRES